MNIKDFEEYVKKNLNIPNVDFSGLEISVVKDIVEALTMVIQKYPALKNSICAFGSVEYVNNQFNLVNNAKKFKEWDDFLPDLGEKMSAVKIGSHIPIIKKGYVVELSSFIALAYGNILIGKDINELNSQAKKNVEYGFHPEHCTTFKSTIYHEMGHVLDFILNLSKDIKLLDLIQEKSDGFCSIPTKISRYAFLEPRFEDIIAEAFSEYMNCPGSNDLIASIGDYIDKKYRLFENSRVFRINQNYSAHLRKVEEQLSKKNK